MVQLKKREVEQRVLGAFGALLHWVKHGEGRKERFKMFQVSPSRGRESGRTFALKIAKI